jgi:prolyl-tRNA editing enzyme YbaK/EbsC (Cys-tRNA(Pro) deacylase)
MWYAPDSVRTAPLVWKGATLLVALRARHTLDVRKVSRELGVDAEEVHPASEDVSLGLGFDPGFETLATDEAVARFVDVRVTWMRSATIPTGTSDLAVTVTPRKLIALTDAAVGDFVADAAPLDEPLHFPSGSTRGPEAARAAIQDVAEIVGFPLWTPSALLTGNRPFRLDGADWSAGLGSPPTEINRATLMLQLQPGGITVILDQSTSELHHELAQDAWPNLVQASLDRPWLTRVLRVRRGRVGITLVAGKDFDVSVRAAARDFGLSDFPLSLDEIADSLVPFPLDD